MSAGVVLSSTVITPGPKKGTIMELLILVLAAVAGVGLFRFWRTRTAH